MPPVNRLMAVAAVAASLALGACKDSTGPGSLNPATMDTQVQVMTSTVEGNAAFQSLLSLFPLFPSFSATRVLQASLPLVRGGAAAGLSGPLSGRMARFSIPSVPHDAAALFPANVLGRTLAWDTASHSYKIDSSIAGAPGDGMRIRLYTVNQLSGEPVVPLQVLGYVQLRDLSTAQADIIGVTLKLGATTVADYTITVVSGTTSGSFTIAGTLAGGDGTGTITVNHTVTVNSGAVDWVSTLSGSNASIRLEIHGDTLGNGTELLRATSGGNTLEISGTAAGNVFSGNIKYNGSTVATISISAGTPVITGTNGHTVSASEQSHLLSLFSGLETVVFETMLGMLAPIFVLAALSVPGF